MCSVSAEQEILKPREVLLGTPKRRYLHPDGCPHRYSAGPAAGRVLLPALRWAMRKQRDGADSARQVGPAENE
jgi:hypothetical protein